ncbi:preprotein translocase subunit SecE [Peptostreptococcaceae bacterium AGR-M142]
MSTQIESTKKEKFSIGKFLQEVKGELKKVHWPNKKELVNYTGVVLVTCLMMAILVGLVDSAMGYFLKLILK